MSALEELKKAGRLTPELEKQIVKEFGARGRKAVEIVEAGKVKRYRDFFVVEGRTDLYVVEGDFCTCRDYLHRLSHKGGRCYHGLSVRIAEATGKYELVDEWYSDRIMQRDYGEGHY